MAHRAAFQPERPPSEDSARAQTPTLGLTLAALAPAAAKLRNIRETRLRQLVSEFPARFPLVARAFRFRRR
jgi:hypothetical protein